LLAEEQEKLAKAQDISQKKDEYLNEKIAEVEYITKELVDLSN